MTAGEVLDLYLELERAGIEIRLDGGWGVDALLGRETRSHADVDIVIQRRDVPRLREWLAARGYRDVERDDTSPWNFVLGDDRGHEVDVHAVTLDAEGNGLYGPIEKGIMYPAAALTGAGTLDGRAARCISAEYMIRFHTGYKLRASDYQDVMALCERFGLEPPDEYKIVRV